MSGDHPSRAHKRYVVDWRVSLKCPDWHLAGSVAAANASRGGLFILTTQPPPLGAIVELGVELPDGTQLSLRGTVQHVVTPERAAAGDKAAGIGVKFLQEHETDLILLEQMAAASTPRTKSVPPPPAPVRADTGPIIGQIAVKRRVAPTEGAASPWVGIDFGNSYASIAGAVGDRLFVIPDDQNRTLQPCLVHVEDAVAAPLVGWAARDRLPGAPRTTVVAPRRYLGRTMDDPDLVVHLASAPVKVVPAADRSPRVVIDGTLVDAERLCAAVFSHLKAQADRELRCTTSRAVLAVPPHFDEPRVLGLRRAAAAAGFEVAELVLSPVCAALGAGAVPTDGELVFVFDMGGSTLEVSILEGQGQGFRLMATSWADRLGGDELDLRIAQWVADSFWRVSAIELRSQLDAWLRLVLACERAKRALSFQPDAHITVEGLLGEPRPGEERYDLHQPLDLATFEKLGAELVQRCLGVCRLFLDHVGVLPSGLGAVVTAGGSTRVPLIRRALTQLFGTEPVHHTPSDEAVCLGAGLRAAELARHRVATVG